DDSPHVTLAWSSDFSRSWQLASWSWSSREFAPSTMLNFGKDYAGARDEFLYFYGGSWGESQNVYLIRVHKGRVKDRDAYEFFHGLDNDQQPTWASAIDQDRPVFTDKNLLNEMNGASKTSVTYNPGVGRYLLTIPHGGMDKLGIFDAPEPWGPWTTVVYDDNWPGVPLDVEHFIAWTQGAPGDQEGLLYVFPSKWISQDGTQ